MPVGWQETLQTYAEETVGTAVNAKMIHRYPFEGIQCQERKTVGHQVKKDLLEGTVGCLARDAREH